MPTKSTAAKSPRHQEQDTRADASAGPKGTALAPPAYGIDFVDRAPAGDGPLQLTPATDRTPELVQAPAPRRARSTPPNRTGLPDGLKSGIESLSGLSMDGVHVHYNSSQPAQLNALAYAQGRDIHVAPGQESHLPHEAWHLVQQAQGRVKPTMRMKDGVPVNDDMGLEHEADVMGAKALQRVAVGTVATATGGTGYKGGGSNLVAQRMKVRGTFTASVLSAATNQKHVSAPANQQAKAQNGFGDRTFVAADTDITRVVDANTYDFTEPTGTKSARYDFNASVTISQWEKDRALGLPAAFATGQPVTQAINSLPELCEIGVEKTGTDVIKVTHFKKN